uniref:Beta-glucosidase 11 isoform X1 n=3 Tax=Rhizophora mucronata TaxID=61149 RepID=A0A2P2JV87_RHIMU
MLLAHASTVRLYKKKYQDKQHGFIGLTLFIYGFVPLTNSTIDAIATERANDFYIGWFVEPLVFGEYPETIKKIAGSRIPVFTIHESRMVKGSFDFIGVNYYNTYYIKDNSDSWKLEQRDVLTDMAVEMLIDRDNIIPNEFPTRPWGLQAILEYIKQAYGNPPVYIHENGQMTRRNSSLEDTSRVKFLHAHMGSVLDSIRNGSNVRGYFVWSLLDVLELLDGYETGFGLYFVDLDDPDLRRYPKLSANWYSLFLKGNEVSLDGIIELQKKFSVAPASVANV